MLTADTIRTKDQERRHQYYLKNKEKFFKKSTERRLAGLDKKNPLVERKSSIKRKYGIEWEEFERAYIHSQGKKTQTSYSKSNNRMGSTLF